MLTQQTINLIALQRSKIPLRTPLEKGNQTQWLLDIIMHSWLLTIFHIDWVDLWSGSVEGEVLETEIKL